LEISKFNKKRAKYLFDKRQKKENRYDRYKGKNSKQLEQLEISINDRILKRTRCRIISNEIS